MCSYLARSYGGYLLARKYSVGRGAALVLLVCCLNAADFLNSKKCGWVRIGGAGGREAEALIWCIV